RVATGNRPNAVTHKHQLLFETLQEMIGWIDLDCGGVSCLTRHGASPATRFAPPASFARSHRLHCAVRTVTDEGKCGVNVHAHSHSTSPSRCLTRSQRFTLLFRFLSTPPRSKCRGSGLRIGEAHFAF